MVLFDKGGVYLFAPHSLALSGHSIVGLPIDLEGPWCMWMCPWVRGCYSAKEVHLSSCIVIGRTGACSLAVGFPFGRTVSSEEGV